jgi:hypothetical protein
MSRRTREGVEAAEGLEMDERGYLEVGERIWYLA